MKPSFEEPLLYIWDPLISSENWDSNGITGVSGISGNRGLIGSQGFPGSIAYSAIFKYIYITPVFNAQANAPP